MCNGVQITRPCVQEGVGRGRSRGQDDSVDDGRKHRDSGTDDRNNPWRCGGTSRAGGLCTQEVGIVVRNQNANGQGAQDIEEQNTPEDSLHSLGDVSARVFGLASGHGHHFHTTVREGGVDEGGPETEETALSTTRDIWLHGTGVSPVLKTKAMLSRDTTTIDDESEDQQTDDGDDLDRGKDELGFAIDGDGENVETQDEDDDDRDPGCDVDMDSTMPILNDGRGSGDFGAQGNGTGVPVVPSHSKTHGVVDVSSAELRNRTRKREPSGHFAKGHHHGKHGEPSEGIAQQDGQRTGLRKGTTNTQKQTGTNGAAEGDELDVTGFESSSDVPVLFGGCNIAVHVGGFVENGGSTGL